MSRIREDEEGILQLSWERWMPATERWATVLETVRLAPTEACLGAVAAGALESLLGDHGDEFIDRIEAEAAALPRFAKALKGVWKSSMSNEVWGRIQSLNAKGSAPHIPGEPESGGA